MEIEFFNALVGSSITDAHAETIAGFMINQLGRIPAVGDEVKVGKLSLRVLDADSRRIRSVEVERLRK